MKKFEDPIETALTDAARGFKAGLKDAARGFKAGLKDAPKFESSQVFAAVLLLALAVSAFLFFAFAG
jgi:hypothetical protein